MANITINLSKWYHALLSAVPLILLVGTAIAYVDFRYLHKEIADTRYIDMQLALVNNKIQQYHRFVQSGGVPTEMEKINYEIDVDQLKKYTDERNKKLGIGDDNE